MQLIRSDTNINFVGQSRVFSIVSLIMIITAVGLMFFKGLNLGIDFAGGTVLQVQLPEDATSIDEGPIRAALADLGYGDAVVVRFGEISERMFRLNVAASQDENRDLSIQIVEGLSEKLGHPVVAQGVESIGARVSAEQSEQGFYALLISWGLILLYVWFRFDLRYAPGAVLALVHDVLFTIGVFVLFGLEFNQQVLAALLVVIGYSLNDTIVIYDRIRENMELRGTTHLEDVVNQSINQTLSRTLLTSLTTIGVVLALLIFGGPVIHDFALALLIGVTVGTYSTVYVASALLIFLERRLAKS